MAAGTRLSDTPSAVSLHSAWLYATRTEYSRPRRPRHFPATFPGFVCSATYDRGLLTKLALTRFPDGREGDIEPAMAVWRGLAAPDYPFDEAGPRAWVEAAANSGPRDQKAQSHQIGAKWHGPRLCELRNPVLPDPSKALVFECFRA
ncbi:hypothetical protein [Rhodococcus sp. NPDC058521]|uniref:hypothetical protein n=1 Tax=Rhodococcus sp. NPDC058521 TaxID=3346536 RepID=UPI0036649E38